MVIKFPGWRYHATEGKRLVQTQDEEALLGSGWSDSPVVVVQPEPVAEPEAPAEEKKSGKKSAAK